jgi:hypothetical protein
VIEEFATQPISWFFLGAWAALSAWRTNQRIVYSPFIVGVSEIDPDMGVSAQEAQSFHTEARDFIPDNRYYSRHFSMTAGQGYAPVFAQR